LANELEGMKVHLCSVDKSKKLNQEIFPLSTRMLAPHAFMQQVISLQKEELRMIKDKARI